MNKHRSSWLADIPDHWEIQKLKHIAGVKFSNVDKNTHEDEIPVQLCNYVDVYANDYITENMDFMTATATKAEIDMFHLRCDDILVTKDSESWSDIAVPALVKKDYENVLCGYHLAQIRPNPLKIHGEYLLRAFQAHGVNAQFCIASNGITRFGLGKYWLDNGLFPVPPLGEQQAIIDYLNRKISEIDAIIEKKHQQVRLLQEKRTAMISHAVTKGIAPKVAMKESGVDWWGKVPKYWQVRKLGYLVSINGGCTPDKSNMQYWQGQIPWVSPKDMKTRSIVGSTDHVSESALGETSLKLLQPPVVLIVVRGMILAHTFPVGLTTVPVTINQDMKALRPIAGGNTDYLALLLEGISGYILSQVDESAHGTKCLRTEVWKNIEIFIPEVAEQKEICAHLHDKTRKIEAATEDIQKSIDMLQEYRAAVVSEAIIGKATTLNKVE